MINRTPINYADEIYYKMIESGDTTVTFKFKVYEDEYLSKIWRGEVKSLLQQLGVFKSVDFYISIGGFYCFDIELKDKIYPTYDNNMDVWSQPIQYKEKLKELGPPSKLPPQIKQHNKLYKLLNIKYHA